MASPRSIRDQTGGIYLLWFLLSLPALAMAAKALMIGGKFSYLYWTGTISCWLMILTLVITPLSYLIGPLPWLKARRRYLGVSCFAYATLHLAAWLAHANVGSLLRSFVRVELLPGWIALGILALLAMTSNDASVRRMGPNWKSLQRWIYLAGLLTLAHWVMVAENKAVVLVAVPAILLSIYRVVRHRSRIAQG